MGHHRPSSDQYQHHAGADTEENSGPIHTGRARKFKRKPFDVACLQCEHSHSRTQVPFALRCASCVDEAGGGGVIQGSGP